MILVNYYGHLGDVLTLAHEAGHAIHNVMTSAQPARIARPPSVLAETVAHFVEMLALDALLDRHHDPAVRLALLGERSQTDALGVFYPMLLCQFELDAYAGRDPRSGSTSMLTTELLCKLWTARCHQAFGKSLFTADNDLEWSWMPQFINREFGTYAYPFAQLVALNLHAIYLGEGNSRFFTAFEGLMAGGGSAAPADQLKLVGVDISNPAWIEVAMREIEKRLVEVEGSA